MASMLGYTYPDYVALLGESECILLMLLLAMLSWDGRVLCVLAVLMT